MSNEKHSEYNSRHIEKKSKSNTVLKIEISK